MLQGYLSDRVTRRIVSSHRKTNVKLQGDLSYVTERLSYVTGRLV